VRRDLVLLLTLLLCSPATSLAQDPVELHQAFLDCTSDAVVMDISAHPDDEDGATLACYRMRFGVRTYSVLFTRGEGGQNEKGPELYEELGVLRSAETEAAGKILGARVRFLNFTDFGYSKTATETFRFWGGQMEPLRRLVYAIRKYRPDVLFTNHNTIDGHGHHQAAGITAILAFDAAADSTMFPEQFSEVAPWQPKKLFGRFFGGGEQGADVANAIGDTDRVRGISYLEIAATALRQHKTQGMERASLSRFTRGKSLYRLLRASSPFERDTTSFLSGIDLWSDHTLERLLPLHREIALLREGMATGEVIRSSSGLLRAIDSLEHLHGYSPLAERILTAWREKLEALLRCASGVSVEGHLEDSIVVARQKVPLTAQVAAERARLSAVRFAFEVPPDWAATEDPERAPELSSQKVSRSYMLRVGDDAIATLPRARAQYRSLQVHQNVSLTVECRLDGFPVSFHVPVDVEVAPRQELALVPAVVRVDPHNAAKGFTLTFQVTNRMPVKTAGRVSLTGPAGWKSDTGTFVIAGEDSTASGSVLVVPPGGVAEGAYDLRFRTDLAEAELPVHVFSLSVAPGLRVGVVRSFDNSLENALREMGVRHTPLTDEELEKGDLSAWHTILIDIRAYLVREGLRKANGRLLDYVRNGGHLVVMYQREQEWKPEYAPFPFTISRQRITREDARVEMLDSTHLLLRSPNRITAGDWQGWMQERAVYMPADVPLAYTRLLASHDPDEKELDTGYLFTRFGKGSYLYTSFVWYRQLKELHPGAFRCFANMISYPLVRGQ
jgi:LmbE family N-acetylglucosaminyl deacetylase